MKKIYAVVSALLLSVSCASAERYFEFAFGTGVGLGQNVMSVSDIFVEELVFDFDKINDSLGASGAIINANVRPVFEMNLNVPVFNAGLHLVNQEYIQFGISKDLFEFLANGNKLGEPISIGLNAMVDSFVSFEIPIGFNVGDFKVKTNLAYYLPIVFMPNPTAEASLDVDSEGNIVVSADANFKFYSLISMEPMLGENATGFDISSLASDIASSGGVDFDLEITYPLFEFLQIGGYTHFPIVPGSLQHEMSGGASFKMKQDSILSSLVESGTVGSPDMSGVELHDFTFADKKYYVNRPFRFGACAYFTPFGDWFEVSSYFGFGTRNPFSADYDFKTYAYPEYSLALDIVGVKVFKFNMETNYIEKAFNQKIGIGLDLRILELDVDLGMSSPSFLQSWTGEGLTTEVWVKVGF